MKKPFPQFSQPTSRINITDVEDLANLANLANLASLWRRHKIPSSLFLGLCLNLILAPAVFAASGNALTHAQAYALGILGLVTVALSLYLFVVMFAPERF